jgi:phosphoribosyl 1,2-cyclic phosphodiesterase
LSDETSFFVRFWGVRGSVACPGESHRRYGGNTSCLEVRCGERLLIFDAGTGLRPLGDAIDGVQPVEADMLLTHTHHDHIAGLPFFSPFFNKQNRFRIWAGHLAPARSLHNVLCQFMSAPLFPVPPQVFSADVIYRDFTAGEALEFGDGIQIRTGALNHPNGATGYRIDYDGRSVCYITDTEHVPGEPDRSILALIEGADYVIYDSSYTDQEFSDYVSWGHSTWQEGARLCDAAGVGTLVIFHHDPSHDDDFMDRVADEAAKKRPGTIVAREGMTLEP